MFKLPGIPSAEASASELADFAEIVCWFEGKVSRRNLHAHLNRLADNAVASGCDDDDEQNAEHLDAVMDELEDRQGACSTERYPFALNDTGTILNFSTSEVIEPAKMIYLYLLMSTRLNMQNQKQQAGIDGTTLLEHLSAWAIRSYLGSDSARSFVFGSASNAQNFQSKVSKLVSALKEGAGAKTNPASSKMKDGKLDVATWIPFADERSGKLIVFAQCKTGTHWEHLISELQPADFIKKWFRDGVAVDPVRAFCVSEFVDDKNWSNMAIGPGILFDRCRLVEHCAGLPAETFGKVEMWTRAAKKVAQKMIV